VTARRFPSLRTSFLAILLLGAVIPLGVVGWWVTRTTQTSGQDLLRDRLEETLDEIVQTVGTNWVSQRSALLGLAECTAVRAALTEKRAISFSTDGAEPSELRDAWAAAQHAVVRVAFYDLDGVFRGRVPSGERPLLGAAAAPSVLPLRMPVYGRGTAGRIGTMEVRLLTSSLLPSDLVIPGLGGSVLALFDASGTTPLLPLTIDAELLASDRFSWAGETWLAVRDTLYEPPLQLALSAPLGALGQPFERAARRGAIALLAVAFVTFALATLATRRITRPLRVLADGADAVARGNLAAEVNAGGPDEIRRVAGAFNTMTENLRRTLQELSQRESLAAVGEFAASLAHEVRNPLTAIRLDLERARKHVADPERTTELMDCALHEIARLDASVTDALRLARSGQSTLAPLDLRQPLEAAFRVAGPHFADRGAHLQPLALPDEPVWTAGDAGALEQLFLNLLLNAAQALNAGAKAGLELTEEQECLRVSVWDQGKGIAPEVMDRIFEPFYSTSPEGTGLGLPIARRIAQAHGGELQMESTVGKGTIARVTLPNTALGSDRQA
jgi:signal transduction histidine kinase